jgi:hypothetical protein
MEITYLGLTLIPLGFIWLVFSERWLFLSAIFFVPFTASALVNFPSGFWLSPVQFLGSLWLLRYIFIMLSFNIKMSVTYWLMTAFFAVVVMSVAMPLLINGDIFIRGTILLDATGPLYFSSRNITLPMYVFFGLLFAAFLSFRNSNQGALQETLRVYVGSAIFVSVWGLFQFSCNLTGFEYPYFIFNNSANEVAQGYSQTIVGQYEEFFRISSVASEPSVMAQFLVPVLPIAILALLLKKTILTTFWDFLAIILIVAVLLVSTSSTAYFGLGLCFVMTPLIALIFLGHAGMKVVGFFTLVIIIIILAYLSSQTFVEFVNDFILNKLSSGSGIERLMTVEYAWSYFLEYPVFGIGWGSATSNDLVVNLLASFGVIGFGIFTLLIGYVIIRLASAVVSSRRIHIFREAKLAEVLSLAVLISFLLSLSLQQTSGFNYGYTYFWMSLGLVIAAQTYLCETVTSIHFADVSRLPASA